MLPGYDKKGRRVFVQRLSIADPNKYKNADVLKVSLMVGDVTIENVTLQTEVGNNTFIIALRTICFCWLIGTIFVVFVVAADIMLLLLILEQRCYC